MTPVPPVSLWPDPDALGPMTDLYELTMMAGYYRVGDGQRSARRSSCSCARCPTTARTWSSPGSNRRSATCSSSPFHRNRSSRSGAGPSFVTLIETVMDSAGDGPVRG